MFVQPERIEALNREGLLLHADSRLEEANWAKLKPKRTDFKLERADIRPKKAD